MNRENTGAFGIRWTVGDVSDLGFEALQLSISGAAWLQAGGMLEFLGAFIDDRMAEGVAENWLSHRPEICRRIGLREPQTT